MFKISFIYFILFFGLSSQVQSQEMLVLQVEGMVTFFDEHETEDKARPLVFGMLDVHMNLKLGEKSSIKLLRTDGKICEVRGPGIFKISELNFLNAKEESFLNKLGDFIVSFMDASHSSESKESYKNSVLAISRGGQFIPVPEFPFSGYWPIETKLLEFSWASSCEKCIYVLELYEMQSRKLVFNTQTAQCKFVVENTAMLLKPGVKYYWTVKVKDQEAEYLTSSFIVSHAKEYEQRIQNIEQQIPINNLQPAAKTLYIMKNLGELGLFNYSICYGREQLLKTNDQQFEQMVRVYYYELVAAHMAERN